MQFKEMTVIHPLFGAIRLNSKFAQVLQLEPFRQLAFKSQLGNKSLSRQILNAKHTRLTHSVGVMYLTEKLLDACEKKFSKYFTITERERETLMLVALGHDVGHIAFSHSLEDKSMMTHEERTVAIFENWKSKINQIFGYDITAGVVAIFKNNMEVKKKGIGAKTVDKLDILFVFTNLLMGAIDCDRMEYIMTDRYMVYGERLDFTNIFDYITIVLLNDAPAIGFEREAVPIIENMLLARFDQYESIYYAENEQPSEMCLQKYVRVAGWESDYKEEITEAEILSDMHRVLKSDKSKRSIQYRLADIILNGTRKDLLFKRFTDEHQYEHFMHRLNSITKRTDIITTDQSKITIYDPKKNKIYIKCTDGIVRDITEVSAKIREYSMKLYFVMVDVFNVEGFYQDSEEIGEEEVSNIRALFKDNPVEIEKKFECSNSEFGLSNLRNILDIMSGVKEFRNEREVHNCDTYFNPTCPVPNGVAMRYRVTEKGDSYFIKLPTYDGTSITKREEYEYKNVSFEEFLRLATDLFNAKGFKMEGMVTVEEGIKITTERRKFLATVCGSVIEFACDFSTYEYKGRVAKDRMLECELKEGDDLALWCLTNHLKNYGFVETNKSKQTRAKEALEIK